MAIRTRGAGFSVRATKKDFVGNITKFTKGNQKLAEAVWKTSTQKVATRSRIPIDKGGYMPVKTGNLRRSQAASTTEMPQPAGPKTKFANDGASNVAAVILNAKMGDRIYIGFRAIYARIQEARNGFVSLTAQAWPKIVAESIRELRAAVRGRNR